MITFPTLPGVEISLLLIAFIGLGTGILSGFTGVGGAFIMTPALIMLGFPANFAVGTSLTWVVGTSIVGTFRHGKRGNVDIQLGLVMIITTLIGVEGGVRVVNWARDIGVADEIVLSISICMLLTVGIYTLLESFRRKRYLDKLLKKNEKLPPAMVATSLSKKLQSVNIRPMLHFTKSQITISLWILLAIGFLIGMIGSIIGVGGGFVLMPALVYLIGLPSFMAVGTGLFQIIFSAAYGSIRHTMSGNVIIFASFIMLIASSIGVQFGVLVTRYVRGISARLILGFSSLVAAIGAILKLLAVLLEQAADGLGTLPLAFTFSGIGLAMIMILMLFIIATRYKKGYSIPNWAVSLVTKYD